LNNGVTSHFAWCDVDKNLVLVKSGLSAQ